VKVDVDMEHKCMTSEVRNMFFSQNYKHGDDAKFDNRSNEFSVCEICKLAYVIRFTQ